MTFDPSPWQRLESALRMALPVTITLLLTLVGAMPLGPPGLGQVMPILPVICVFYWAVYRRDLMPLTAIFVIGVLHDALSGAPLGSSAIALLVLNGLVSSQRRFFHGKTLAMAWAGFAAIGGLVMALMWLIASAYNMTFMLISSGVIQAVMTVALYPVLALPFGVLLRELLQTVPAAPR